MIPLRTWNFQALAEGGFSLLPGGGRLFRGRGTGGSRSARYCYSVWLRHLAGAAAHGFRPGGTVVELGPGDSLGTGLAALLGGARRYLAIDTIRFATPERNLQVLEELVALFREQAPVPGPEEFPRVRPLLESWEFPAQVLPKGELDSWLAESRIAGIRRALARPEGGGPVRYLDPGRMDEIEPGSVDFLFSQAVLEHVEDLYALHRDCARRMKPGGLVSHVIDLKSHGAATDWNGHWTYPAPLWRLLLGRRPLFLNRQPASVHLDAMEAAGFELLEVVREHRPNRFSRRQLAPPYRTLPEEDLETAGLYVVARAPDRREGACAESPDSCSPGR